MKNILLIIIICSIIFHVNCFIKEDYKIIVWKDRKHCFFNPETMEFKNCINVWDSKIHDSRYIPNIPQYQKYYEITKKSTQKEYDHRIREIGPKLIPCDSRYYSYFPEFEKCSTDKLHYSPYINYDYNAFYDYIYLIYEKTDQCPYFGKAMKLCGLKDGKSMLLYDISKDKNIINFLSFKNGKNILIWEKNTETKLYSFDPIKKKYNKLILQTKGEVNQYFLNNSQSIFVIDDREIYIYDFNKDVIWKIFSLSKEQFNQSRIQSFYSVKGKYIIFEGFEYKRREDYLAVIDFTQNELKPTLRIKWIGESVTMYDWISVEEPFFYKGE